VSLFRDRRDAGQQLADALARYGRKDDVLILALPRGGVPVAFEVARRLHAPLDVFIVRKLGLPGQEELAMGAVASGGVRALNEDVLREAHVPPEVVDYVAAAETEEIRRRELAYRWGRTPEEIGGKTVIVVDDGLATGATMRAAVRAIRNRKPARIVVAVPVGARTTCNELAAEADEIVCLAQPSPFRAVGLWYDDFSQTSDEEVCELLSASARSSAIALSS
jgi:putative phosphoribosyl transferase